MTTIGSAVLQIIPSLKGVTDAIEKQIDGKVVEVKVAPKVDQAAAKKAGKDAGESITKEVKDAVVKGEIGKAVGESVTASVKKSSTGRDVARILVGDLGDGVKQGIASENLGGAIKDAVLPTITQIGTQISSGAAQWSSSIAASLRSGDIQGATNDIATAVQNTTSIIANIGATFGVQTQGVQNFSNDVAGILSQTGGDVQDVINQVTGITNGFKDSVDQVTNIGTQLGLLGPKAAAAGEAISAGLSEVVIPVWLSTLLGNKIANAITPGTENDHDAGWVIDRALGAPKRIFQEITGQRDPNTGELRPPPIPQGGPFGSGNGPHGRPPAKDPTGGLLTPFVVIGPDGKPVLPGRAAGGQISGPGTRISDSILAMVSNGEYIVNAAAAQKNLPLLEMINSGKVPGFAAGGIVPPDVSAAQALAGTGYSQANRTDCSGMAARVINQTLGTGGGLMSTKTAAEWLAARGFVPGIGGPGQISVGWYDHGPNPNDGHMAMTLSDGENAEAGGANGVFTIGGKAAGASSPQFDQHMHLPTVYGEGPAGSSSASSGGSVSAAVMGSLPAPASGGGATPSSSSSGGSGPLPTSITGLSSWGLADLKGPETGPGKRQFKYGKALDAAVTDQVSSALGVLGVPDSPNWLKGISSVIGQIKVGGHDPSGVSDGSIFDGSNLFGSFGQSTPLSASPPAGGTTPPDNVHGSRAGQQPGTVNNWTINARDTEDAFIKANRWQMQKAAAKLDRF